MGMCVAVGVGVEKVHIRPIHICVREYLFKFASPRNKIWVQYDFYFMRTRCPKLMHIGEKENDVLCLSAGSISGTTERIPIKIVLQFC
jgi:hypothetical protein